MFQAVAQHVCGDFPSKSDGHQGRRLRSLRRQARCDGPWGLLSALAYEQCQTPHSGISVAVTNGSPSPPRANTSADASARAAVSKMR